jgi:acetoacetyl-CoA synthetase
MLPIAQNRFLPTGAGGTAPSQMAAFCAGLAAASGRYFASYEALHAYSVREPDLFWRFLLSGFAGAGFIGNTEPVRTGEGVEHSAFFPNVRLNYAASLLDDRAAPAAAFALAEAHPDAPPSRITRAQLRQRVEHFAGQLCTLGVQPGDRVVAVLRNDAWAAVAALGCAAVGATFSSVSPDMAVPAIVERFAPLAPVLLVAHVAPRAFDAGPSLADKVELLLAELPSARALVQLDGGGLRMAAKVPVHLAAHLRATALPHAQWPRLPFNHPLFVMFSSGTTGKPKCIVHGAGGTLLEHLKEHRLHTDLRPGERMYFHTSCAWMMWNWQLSALASGVEIVTYDGPVSSADVLWKIAAAHRVHVFGTSPAYLRFSRESHLVPRRGFELGALRAILSTGAVLEDGLFDWVRDNVGALPLQSISGGTDIIGCFVLGHPDLPVRRGLAQCKSLGLDVQSWEDGRPAPPGQMGELVCASPFPSRPLGFFGDADGARFHAAYFERHPGVWTHGDLVTIDAQGGTRLHGRCDGILNVRGIKFAPAEVLRIVEAMPEVRMALLVPLVGEAGMHARDADEAADRQRLVALVVPREGAVVDAAFAGRVRREVTAQLSPVHAPDLVVAVDDLPVTFSGKLSETAAREAVNARPVANDGALRNPQCLARITQAVSAACAPRADGDGPGKRSRGEADDRIAAGLLDALVALWRVHLGVADANADDNFFELGGHSLAAVRMLQAVEQRTGRAVPLSALVQSPTPRRLAALLQSGAAATRPSVLVTMRPGVGRPVYIVHGLSGTIVEALPLARLMRTPRPVIGVQARAIDGGAPDGEVPGRVEAMALDFADAIVRVQPRGPYAICGFSFGGVVALEIARELQRRGQAVELLCLLDPYVHQALPLSERLRQHALRVRREMRYVQTREWPRFFMEKMRHAIARVQVMAGWRAPVRASDALGLQPAQRRVYDRMDDALRAYRPSRYEGGRIAFIRTDIPLPGYYDPLPVWRGVARAGLDLVPMPDGHLDLVGKNAAKVAGVLDGLLRQANA